MAIQQGAKYANMEELLHRLSTLYQADFVQRAMFHTDGLPVLVTGRIDSPDTEEFLRVVGAELACMCHVTGVELYATHSWPGFFWLRSVFGTGVYVYLIRTSE